MNRSFARCVVAGVALAGLPTAQSEPESAKPNVEQQELVAKARKRLREVGYDIPDTVVVGKRTPKQVLADLDAHQDLLFPEQCFELQFALLDGLGLRAGRSAKQLRRQAVARTARGMGAYFDPPSNSFILLETATRKTAEAISGSLLPLIAHELVHANQHARTPLGEWFGQAESLDASLARRITLEGEAEVAALVALSGDRSVDALRRQDTPTQLEAILAGELNAWIYHAGRKLASVRHADGGLDAVRAAWDSPPVSSEQALHPIKLGLDEPTSVRLPGFENTRVVAQTTFGELMIFQIMRQLKIPPTQASIAAAGWDGDHFVILDHNETPAVCWRTVWDRQEDAKDFAVRIGGAERGQVIADGRVVDWVQTGDEVLERSILQTLATTREQPPVRGQDQATTARVERDLLANQRGGQVDGELWHHPLLGLTIPIPDGWQLDTINGTKILRDSRGAPGDFAMNINVAVSAQGPVRDIEHLRQVNEGQLERLKFVIDELEITTRDSVEVLAGGYHGRYAGRALHFLVLGYLRDKKQIYVTTTVTEAQWAAHANRLRAAMAAIRIAKPR